MSYGDSDQAYCCFLSGSEAAEDIYGEQYSVNKCFPWQNWRTEKKPNLIEKDPKLQGYWFVLELKTGCVFLEKLCLECFRIFQFSTFSC